MSQRRQKSVKSETEEKKSIGEKIVFWVGSVAAIILSLNTIYEKVIEPKDAKIDVRFFESSNKELCIFPSINTSLDSTEAIPFQLSLKNTGGKIAKHVKLYISFNPSIRLQTKYQKEVKRTWESPNENMSQVSLELEDLNPGESFLIPISVVLYFPKEIQKRIANPKKELNDQSFLDPLGYTLNCDISSETSLSTNSKLSILLGDLDVLRNRSSKIFWIGHGNEGVQLIEVKEDYPKK